MKISDICVTRRRGGRSKKLRKSTADIHLDAESGGRVCPRDWREGLIVLRYKNISIHVATSNKYFSHSRTEESLTQEQKLEL